MVIFIRKISREINKVTNICHVYLTQRQVDMSKISKIKNSTFLTEVFSLLTLLKKLILGMYVSL